MSTAQVKLKNTGNLALTHLHDIDPSWINTIPNGELINKLRGSSRISQPILDSIHTNLNLVEVDLDKLKGFAYKIHFYSSEELQELVLKVGVTPFAKKLKLMISGDDVRQNRKHLGDTIYDFAIHNTTPLDISGHNEKFEMDENIHTNTIAFGYRTLDVALKNIPNNCMYKLPLSWKKIHDTMEPLQVSDKEKLFFINLIKSFVNDYPPRQSTDLN